jgi:hypothetical protein
MQETELNSEHWEAFLRRWENTIEQIPGMKEAMLQQVGTRVRAEVRNEIDRAGVKDRAGRVKMWQNRYVGSGLGYVAVRSESVEVTAGPKGRQVLNAGALTNFLTSGHKVRQPSGRSRRYVPRAKMARVKEYGFYKQANTQAEKIGIQEAEEFLNRFKVTLEG